MYYMDHMRKSQRQEARGAKMLGGRITPGSGNGLYFKNDVRTEDLSVEYKRTDKKQFSLKIDELLKAERQALLDNRDMLFGIDLGKRDWLLLPAEDYVALRNRVHKLERQLAELQEDHEPE